MLQLASTAVFTVMIGLYADASRDSASLFFRLLAYPVFELVSSNGQLRIAWLIVSLLAVNLWLASAKWFDDFRILEGLHILLFLVAKMLIIRPEPALRGGTDLLLRAHDRPWSGTSSESSRRLGAGRRGRAL